MVEVLLNDGTGELELAEQVLLTGRITALAGNAAAVDAYRAAGFAPQFIEFEKTLGD